MWINFFFIIFTLNADTLNLNQAIEIALLNNKVELLRTIEYYNQSNAFYKEARAGYMPKLDLSYNYDYSKYASFPDNRTHEGGVTLDYSFISPLGGDIQLSSGYTGISNTGISNPDVTYSPTVSISLTQPLSFAEIAYNRNIFKQLKHSREYGEVNFKNSVEDFVITVMYKYITLIKSQRSLDRNRISLTRSKRMLDIARLKAKGGEISEDEVMNLEVEVALKEDEIMVTENSYRNQKEGFLRTLGIKMEEFILDENVVVKPCSLLLKDCIQIALNKRKEIKLSLESVHFAELSYKEAGAKNKPSINLNYTHSFSDESTSPWFHLEDIQNNRDWSFNVSLSFPIIDGGTYKASFLSAISNLTIVKIDYEELKYNIKREVEEIYNELQMNKKRLESLKRNVKIAKKALYIAEEKFKLGIISQDDVNRTEERLLLSQSSLDDATFDHVLLNARLLKSMGEFEDVYDWEKIIEGRAK
ncbi:TolC family protein [candidate division WOR-3 bacterium]|nr:TolC family protein [candidate division WOR-3 bacterium]